MSLNNRKQNLINSQNLVFCSLVSFFILLVNTIVFAQVDMDRNKKRIVFLGDSLTDGFGVSRQESYPGLIESKIQQQKLSYTVQNAGVSGDTTAGGLRRIKWLLKERIDILVLALGANDGLRGFAPDNTKTNLEKIIATIRAANPQVKILLCGMLIPPNMGPEYEQEFRSIFPKVAKEQNTAFLPFLLEGVAAIRNLNQADGIHPNKTGHEIMAENVWKALRPLLAS